MQRRSATLALAALVALAAGLSPVQARPPGPGNAVSQDFRPPEAGSYRLPPIQPAPDGWVLDGSWWPLRLSNYTEGALTLLSFVYTYCTDPQGCPLAYETMAELKRRVLAEPALRGRVRLVSLSFDPANDTPQAMQVYGGEQARSQVLPWHFLTTYSLYFLQPILQCFGQDVDIEQDGNGRPTRAISHMLKVFLLDQRGQVREIYSAAFLHPEVMVNDLKTLAAEQAQRRRGGRSVAEPW